MSRVPEDERNYSQAKELGSDVDLSIQPSTHTPYVSSIWPDVAQDSEEQTQQNSSIFQRVLFKPKEWIGMVYGHPLSSIQHPLEDPGTDFWDHFFYSNHIIFVRINHFDLGTWTVFFHLEACCQAAYSNHHKVKNDNTDLSRGWVYTTTLFGSVTLIEL